MSTLKPIPPTWAELEHDEKLARTAAYLGATVTAKPSQSDRVFSAILAAVDRSRAPVTVAEMREADPSLPVGTITSALTTLLSHGRVLKAGRGQYLPVPEAAMG